MLDRLAAKVHHDGSEATPPEAYYAAGGLELGTSLEPFSWSAAANASSWEFLALGRRVATAKKHQRGYNKNDGEAHDTCN